MEENSAVDKPTESISKGSVMSQSIHTDTSEPSHEGSACNRKPLIFFLLVYALSIPFWLIGSFTDLEILPGLPLSSLNIIIPVVAASILVYCEDRFAGVSRLLKRAFDFKRVDRKVW